MKTTTIRTKGQTRGSAPTADMLTPWWLWVVAYVLLMAAGVALGLAGYYALDWLAIAVGGG